MTERRVTIARLGAQGDGVADAGGAPLFVPGALPGEAWSIAADGAAQLLTASPERRAAPCVHFDTCGGCTAQHMSDALYAAWKQDVVAQAFAHRGLDVAIAPLRRIAPGTRRRAVFGVTRGADGGVLLGFREEGQHRLVDLSECLILDPQIVRALPALRALAGLLLASAKSTGPRVTVTKLDQGLDANFDCDRSAISAETLQRAATLARQAGIVRLSAGGDPIMSEGQPTLTIGGVAITPQPGLFLQAVPEAEAAMIELVLAGLPKVKAVADLFAGTGTFTFALARRARVTAVDGDKCAIATLATAARQAQGLKPIDSKVRDLFREPLSPRELEPFEAVVLDPPRAGAQAQSERLARSKVGTVVAVSCNPATLARDVRILVDGGYRVHSVTPIDQFVYSPHIEAVAVLRR